MSDELPASDEPFASRWRRTDLLSVEAPVLLQVRPGLAGRERPARPRKRERLAEAELADEGVDRARRGRRELEGLGQRERARDDEAEEGERGGACDGRGDRARRRRRSS